MDPDELQELQADPYLGIEPVRLQSNWFSVHNTQRVYHAFLDLDNDMDGELSKDEFRMWGGGGFTQIFIDRLYEVHIFSQGRSRHGGMDFQMFVDFNVAWEAKKHAPALKFFWKVLDLNQTGRLTHVEIHTFFREVYQKWLDDGQYDDLRMEDVRDEIFDMVPCQQEGIITLADFLRSEQAATVVEILCDYNSFWRYDNRESLMQEGDEEEGM